MNKSELTRQKMTGMATLLENLYIQLDEEDRKAMKAVMLEVLSVFDSVDEGSADISSILGIPT